jgi:hypothetical protein
VCVRLTTRLDTVSKRPQVQLPGGLVIDIRRVAVGAGAVGLLLVEQEVSAHGNNAGRVHAGGGTAHGNTVEVRLGGETLRQTTTVHDATLGAGHGAGNEVVAAGVELVANGTELVLVAGAVPRHCNTSSQKIIVLLSEQVLWGVGKAHTGQGGRHGEARHVKVHVDAHGTVLGNKGGPRRAVAGSNIASRDDGDLLGIGHGRDQGLGLLVGLGGDAQINIAVRQQRWLAGGGGRVGGTQGGSKERKHREGVECPWDLHFEEGV